MTGSIGCLSGSPSARSRSQVVEQIFQKADTNRDGTITKKELTQALQSDTVELGSEGASATVDRIFQKLDTGNQGYITRQETADGLDQLPSALTGGGSVSVSGGSSKGVGAGGGGVAVSTDPADTNQDGRVSAQELLDYVQKQYTKSDSVASLSITYGG